MVEMISRWAWTSMDDGSGIGTTYVIGNVPDDAKFIDPPPEPSQGVYAVRYWYDEPNSVWVLKTDAWPSFFPEDYYAWDGSPRYTVDETDPLRNSWVLDPNAQPVEPPEET